MIDNRQYSIDNRQYTVFNGWGCNRPIYLSWGAGNDQVFYCMRPTAECNRTLGHSTEGQIVWSIASTPIK